MKRLLVAVSAVVIGLLLQAQPADAQYEGSVDINAVVVPVTVRNKAGRVVTGVSRKDFRLKVDGIAVPIQDLDLESDLPISCLLYKSDAADDK